MRRLSARFGSLVLASMSALVLLGGAASAQTFTVSNLENSGAGSLRAAVEAANGAPGADTIGFAGGLIGTIHLSGTGLTIKDSVAIEGPGAGQLTVEQTSKEHRVFKVGEFAAPGPVTLTGMHLTGGRMEEGGADIYDRDPNVPLTIERCLVTNGSTEGSSNYGGAISAETVPLIVRDSTFAGNEARAGGAIWAGGDHGETVTIENSTFEENVAEGDGGAILVEVQESGLSKIVGSTFVGNRAEGGRGGALLLEVSEGASLGIDNSTFAGNRAEEEGGAIDVGGEDLAVTIEDSTVAGNLVTEAGGEGGGISDFNIQRLTDTIVADNSASVSPDFGGKAVAEFDLFGNPGGAELTETAPGSDLVGVDPQLGPLADNGGPTETMALPPTSPAVNKGGGSLATDQRGDPRPSVFLGVPLSTALGANGADIGAYELQASPPPASPPPPGPAKSGASGAPKVRLACPKRAGSGGCRFALQVVSGKPRRVKGKGGRPHLLQPKPESAVAKLKLGAGKSWLVTLKPKARFAVKLDAAKMLLVRQAEALKGKTATTYRRLKVVG